MLTIYALVLLGRRADPAAGDDVTPRALGDLVLGSVVGTPFGVWALATLPISGLNRLIGLMLLVAVTLELRGVMPRPRPRVGARRGLSLGLIGGSVGTPGPPVVMYATTQGWSPRTKKANVMAFFVVNQAVILVGFWWAGLLTREASTLAAVSPYPPSPVS